MNSAIYEGVVKHRRRDPDHEFEFRLFMLYVDLDEVDDLFTGPLWSARRPSLGWFRRADYLGDKAVSLDRAVRDVVEKRVGVRPTGPIRLLTNARYFGVGFNPVSLYYCFDPDGEAVEWVVAEVTNTPWRERHIYVLEPDADSRRFLRASHAKQLHVSPFLDMALEYRWKLSAPGERLIVQIDNVDADGNKAFDATLWMRRHAWTRRTRDRMFFRYPAMSLQVLTGIYRQALRLWRKGAHFYPHAKRHEPAPALHGQRKAA